VALNFSLNCTFQFSIGVEFAKSYRKVAYRIWHATFSCFSSFPDKRWSLSTLNLPARYQHQKANTRSLQDLTETPWQPSMVLYDTSCAEISVYRLVWTHSCWCELLNVSLFFSKVSILVRKFNKRFTSSLRYAVTSCRKMDKSLKLYWGVIIILLLE
jgi:hypothetical protein